MNPRHAIEVLGDDGAVGSRHRDRSTMRMMRFARSAVLTAMVTAVVSCSASSSSVRAQEPVGGTVEIVIHRSAYQVPSGFLKVGEPATIHLTNTDSITHGFEWVLTDGEEIRIETEGLTTYTRAFSRLHLKPGEEVRIRFIPVRSGKFTFKCDIHPGMEGEVFALRVGRA